MPMMPGIRQRKGQPLLAALKDHIHQPQPTPSAPTLQDVLSAIPLSKAEEARALRYAYHQLAIAQCTLHQTWEGRTRSSAEKLQWWAYEVRWVNRVSSFLVAHEMGTTTEHWERMVLGLVREREKVEASVGVFLGQS
ncbi:hypothetical protein LTR36_004973 [Oleoguttula mirabilis]|uniref:Uncharacterized protein n=1 Tax=Oleoguttula mirabilis TaxID=1507867 RepID=A0AAV9JVB1_9PEZI|nr:hypothetical protein LTR36_004973 [Oleoguttula mirabilis]